jgi:zinc transporter ZupT
LGFSHNLFCIGNLIVTNRTLNNLIRVSKKVQRRILGISNAFAGGLFLAAGFVHLLAESNESKHLIVNHAYKSLVLTHSDIIDNSYPWGLLFCSLGFLFAFFFEKVFFSKYHTHGEIEDEENRKVNFQNNSS